MKLTSAGDAADEEDREEQRMQAVADTAVGVLVVEPHNEAFETKSETSAGIDQILEAIKSVVRTDDVVEKLSFQQVCVTVRMKSVYDLHVIARRLNRRLAEFSGQKNSNSVCVGGVALPLEAEILPETLQQIALYRLDLARKQNASSDVVVHSDAPNVVRWDDHDDGHGKVYFLGKHPK